MRAKGIEYFGFSLPVSVLGQCRKSADYADRHRVHHPATGNLPFEVPVQQADRPEVAGLEVSE